eukprot:Opistho-2@88991
MLSIVAVACGLKSASSGPVFTRLLRRPSAAVFHFQPYPTATKGLGICGAAIAFASFNSSAKCDPLKMADDGRRALHWVFKIGNLKTNLQFLEGVLGMHVLRHEEFNQGCEATCNGPYARPWSKTMIGYGPESHHFVLELTYNYGIRTYKRGNDLRYIAVEGENLVSKAAAAGLAVESTAEGSFVRSPDGYSFRIKDAPQSAITQVSIAVGDLAAATDYYSKVLLMKTYSTGERSVVLGYADNQAKLELVQSDVPVDHAAAFGRIAFAINDIHPVHKAVVAAGDKIQTEPVRLDTPGKPTVEVVILADRDGYEICFVGEEGFAALSTTKPGDDAIDWAMRTDNGADR